MACEATVERRDAATGELAQELAQRISVLDFLASAFLTLPDEGFAGALMSLDWPEGRSDACDAILRYAKEMRGARAEDVVLDLGRDRARLVRGANNEGMRAPYESLYTNGRANESMGSLNRFYQDAGFRLDESVKDTGEQIGVEMAFARLLLAQRLRALQEGDDEAYARFGETYDHFMAQHLGRWAHAYADEMERFASTDFYRGVAMLIKDVL